MPFLHLPRFSFIGLLVLLLGSPLLVLGQLAPEDEFGPIVGLENDSESVFLLPTVLVHDVTVNPADATGALSGSFVLENRDERIVGDLDYTLSLIDEALPVEVNTLVPEDHLTYDRVLVNSGVSLQPGERRTIAFTYTPPAVPAGNYRLRVQTITSRGQELGWRDAPVTIAGSVAGFALIEPVLIITDAEPEGLLPPDGPNASPGSEVTLQYTVTNIGTGSLTGVPTIDVYQWNDDGVAEATISGQLVTIAAGEEQEHTFAFPAPVTPTAYQVVLKVLNQENQRVSTLADYRLVVTGVSGRILSALFTTLTDQQAVVEVELVGPADREQSITAQVTAELLDGQVVVGSTTTAPQELNELASQTLELQFPLKGALKEPGIRLTLMTAAGVVLDTYELAVTAPEQAAATPVPAATETKTDLAALAPWLVGGVVLVVILAILVVMLTRAGRKNDRGPQNTPPSAPPASPKSPTPPQPPASSAGSGGTPTALGLLALAVVGGGLIWATVAQSQSAGNGVQYVWRGYSNQPKVHVFVNDPIHNNDPSNPSEKYDPASVPVAVTISWPHCNNRVTRGILYVDHLKSGGKVAVTPKDYVYHDDELVSLGFKTPDEAAVDTGAWQLNAQRDWECKPWGSGCGQRYKGNTINRTLVGSISIDPALENTTLRFLGYKRQRIGVSVGNPEPIESWIGIFSWLNLKSSDPQCNDDIDNDGDGPVDCQDPGCYPNDNPAGVCDPTDPSENESPIANITTQQALLNEQVQASGAASHDPDGQIVGWEWTITDPNGIVTQQSGEVVTFPGAAQGNYILQLVVTDNLGATGQQVTSVPVIETSIAAIIRATGNTVKQPVSLDGSQSIPVNKITTWQWTALNPAGEAVTVTGAGQSTAEFTPELLGDYTVELTITDDRGRTDTSQLTVIVGVPPFRVGEIIETE